METPEKLAYRLAKLCQQSYKNKNFNGDFVFIQKGNYCCLITENECGIYCAFRGTDELKDLETFFSYEKCHDICREVCKYVELSSKPIFLTGHSIGGLIAQICSTNLIYFDEDGLSKSRVTKIVTFGSPKCKLLILANHDSWVNGNDIIPELPFNTINNGQLYFIRGAKWKFWINSHSIENYIRNIKKVL